MAPLIWFTVGVAVWHFVIFLPDRFWGGIVGAFLGGLAGAMVTGAIAQIAIGASLGDTDMATFGFALPGAFAGLAIAWAAGVRQEQRPARARS